VITRIFGSPNKRARRAAIAAVAAIVALLSRAGLLSPSDARAEVTPASSSAPPGLSSDAAAVSASRELAAWLEGLVSKEASARKGAMASLDRASPGTGQTSAVVSAAMLPAIAERIAGLGKTADRTAMAAVIAELVKPRSVPPDEIAGRLPDGGFDAASDWGLLVMASPAPDRTAWRDLTSLLGLARLLTRVGTTAAARELAAAFGIYGELLRPDLERQMVTMGDRALPALIEMRRAEPKEHRLFALKLLEALGKAIPGEAVQTGDDALLAEVLVAYGRAKEVDAARVVLSFANSNRRPIREAARQAVLLMGEAGASFVRESYENMTNQKPSEAWGWEAAARELFRVLDRARLVEAHALMDEGLAALREQDLEKAAGAFDRALARDPSFEKRVEMAPAYLALGRKLMKDDPKRALATLQKAQRLDPSSSVGRQAESAMLVLEAKERAGHGVVDTASLGRAIELDPDNADARAELLRIEAESEDRSRRLAWYSYGALAALLALGGLGAAFVHGRRSAG
jgi:tetratricopeptide (TPR) repeat protein